MHNLIAKMQLRQYPHLLEIKVNQYHKNNNGYRQQQEITQ